MNLLLIAAVAVVNVPATTLPPVTIEASRLEQSRLEIAAHVEVVDREAIDASGAANTVELLEKRANLFLRKPNPSPAQAQISLRGYGANSFGRVRILVDGVELNGPDMSPQNLLRVPMRSIQRIEILHGPQTVLHGSEASAGVINIISETNASDRQTELEVHGGNLGAVGTHLGTRGGFEDLGLTYFADFDYDRADGWRENSNYEFWSLKGGIRQHFDNGSQWSLSSFFADSQYGLPGGLLTGDGYGDWQPRARDAEDPDSRAHNDIYGLNLSAKVAFNDENTLEAGGTFRNRQSKSYGYLEYDVYSFDYRLKYANTSHLFSQENRFDLGTDLKHDLLRCNAYNPQTDFGGNNSFARFSGAIFAREEFFPLEELSLFGGVRGEWFHSRDRYQLSATRGTVADTTGSAAGEIGLNWRPIEDLKLFVKWSRFYHAPLADELFSSYGIPNLDLHPEEGHNTELGVDWSIADFNFNLTGFHTELEDEIMYLNYANCNAPDATARSGLETSLTWEQEKVGSAGILYSLIHARFTEGPYRSNRLPLVPEQQLRLFGEYFLTDEVAVHGGYRFVGRQRYGGDFANVGGFLPNYGIFDLGFRLMPKRFGLEGLTFAFTIDNLLNRRYCDYGEYIGSPYVYPACGRSFLFTIRYEF